MPLPWKDRKNLEQSLVTMHQLRQRKMYETREENDKIIIKELEEGIANYFVPLKESIQKLMDAGLERSWERRWNIYGIPVLRVNVHKILGMELPAFQLKGPEIPVRAEVLAKVKTREAEEERIDSEYKLARELATQVINKFGSVKYLLTQFPELRDIYSIQSRENKDWKPNPSYKVPPRSSFEHCDAFVIFLGGCAMEGIKP